MYPRIHAERFPDKPAQIMAGTGEVITYRELDERSNRLAQLAWSEGLRPGGHIAVILENNPRYLEIAWAALRSGLHVTTVNRHLTADEAAYIINDCGARILIASRKMAEVAAELLVSLEDCPVRLMVDGTVDGYRSYEDAVAGMPAEPLAEEPLGEWMLYSSGTTGRPKGIKRPLTGKHASEGHMIAGLVQMLFGMDENTTYLSPAPMYHSAPLAFSVGVQTLGGTVVVMERFDPDQALAAIERHRVTHSQWVPTMFSRMLALPDAVRARYDLSSHKVAIHAAAPCPPVVKERMIDWWGPILHEYYGATELHGMTHLTSEEWLRRRGSVGKPLLGVIHICDEEGAEVPAGEDGLIYFEREQIPFEYHNDERQTRMAQHPAHPTWSTVGDVGHVDEDGFLYLTDRQSNMIISGGVNIYPQEIENVLAVHPAVLDVAVIGVPSNGDLGEEVKAVVQAGPEVSTGPELEAELIAYVREHLAHYKAPRSVDFIDELPRLPTGKLYKRLLKDRYWAGRESRIG